MVPLASREPVLPWDAAHLVLAKHSEQCHVLMPNPRVPPAKSPTGHQGPLYARQEQSLRSPALPLASAHCSPPPQKFLQLMGNPTASHVSCSPGGGMGHTSQGMVPCTTCAPHLACLRLCIITSKAASHHMLYPLQERKRMSHCWIFLNWR